MKISGEVLRGLSSFEKALIKLDSIDSLSFSLGDVQQNIFAYSSHIVEV